MWGFMFLYGAWMASWRHLAVVPGLLWVTVVAHMPWDPTRSELDYVHRMRPIIDGAQRNVLVLSPPQEVYISRLFDRCNDWYL